MYFKQERQSANNREIIKNALNSHDHHQPQHRPGNDLDAPLEKNSFIAAEIREVA